MYDNPWAFEGGEFHSEDIGEYVGFVYQITNLTNGMKYIGKKNFARRVTKPPLKGKTRKRRSVVESDWQEYYGSNKQLQEDVVALGSEKFKREILRLCKTKGEMSYYEAKFQFERDVLFRDDYYNSWIAVKVSRSHVKV